MSHFHPLNRALLILAFAWASVAILALAYWGYRWEQEFQRKTARLAMHIAGLLAPIDGAELVEARSARFESARGASEAATLMPANAPGVRSCSLLCFERAPEAGLVSVIIPSYNRAPIIGRAIESALAQTYDRLEVIVVDDGSTDETRSIVEGFGPRAVYVHQSNAGVSAARNRGIRHAKGEYVAFLDSDDAWHPWKIEAQTAVLARNPKVGLVWTDMAAIDENDVVMAPRYLRSMYSAYDKVDMASLLTPVCELGALSSSVPPIFATAPVGAGDVSGAILFGNLIHTSTVLFRRSWCERTGGFDESYARAGEDYEFYIRLTSPGPVAFIDAPSTLYRIGAADQLTAPSMLLEIARNNLRAVQTWLPRSGSRPMVDDPRFRERLAESFAWVGELELEAGRAADAARDLSRSLSLSPRLDRRTVMLIGCAVPRPVRKRIRAARRSLLDQYARAELGHFA